MTTREQQGQAVPVNDNIVFVDTETTGLDPTRHTVWEVALIYPNTSAVEGGHEWFEQVFAIEPSPEQLSLADPNALRMTNYYKRWAQSFPHGWHQDQVVSREIAAKRVAQITEGRHLVGAVPSFDANFLEYSLLRPAGFSPAWHYHLVDVEALAAGKLGMEPPWDSTELAEKLDVTKLDGKHTALGDARWAKVMYDAVMNGR